MFKNYIFVLIVCFCFQSGLNAQTPCVSGMAGVYECNDYDLMSRIPVSELGMPLAPARANDIWGWTDPLDGKEYAIVGTRNSTAFVDVSNPLNPILLGRIESANSNASAWRDIKVYNNHAFIVADIIGDHGMQVFDLTLLRDGVDADLTYDGTQVLRYQGDGGTGDLVIGSCHNIVINESEGVAYLVGCSSANGGGPIFVDITNPTSPTVIGDYTAGGYSHDAQVVTYTGPDTDYYDPANGISGTQLYIGSNGAADQVVILNVTDKNNITLISSFTYPQIAYAHQGWFTDDQRYFILGDEIDELDFGNNSRTLVFDFLDLDLNTNMASIPANLMNTYLGPTAAIDHNGYVKGNTFYLANYRAGLRVLDVSILTSSNNTNAEIGFFDTHPGSNSDDFNGTWSVYPYFASGNIIISDIERGLFVVRKSGTTLSTPSIDLSVSFSLFPNPTTSISTLKSDNDIPIETVEIYSILGQEVFKKDNINALEYVLPTTGYSAGIYIIKINNVKTKKLVIK
ncbi:choice-of-anchor B family protein [Lacinutrix jangbogonensis]|uniref:choice-of-anchor B family protein n=1 Tax=Lacinutrix jangbogonensis TaxID=1469557 RepID=UPI00053D740D|nr:choice-of-anchor B family protein [Lacinutrix jangbogonensis]